MSQSKRLIKEFQKVVVIIGYHKESNFHKVYEDFAH